MQHSISFNRRRRGRRGAALVEFAIVLPIIFLGLTGMLELSRVLMLQHTADTAAYEGARNAMVAGAKSQDAISMANSLLAANRLKSTTVTVSPTDINEETPTITVTVEIPVAQNSWLPPFWFQPSKIVSEVTLITERPPIVQLTGLPVLRQKKVNLKTVTGLL